MKGLRISVSGTLKRVEDREFGEKHGEVYFSDVETLGEVSLVSGGREENLSDEQLHRLFNEGTYAPKAANILLEEHPKLQNLLDELDCDAEDVRIDLDDDFTIEVFNKETVLAAANSTDEPLQALLSYAYSDGCVRELDYNARDLLSERLDELSEVVDEDQVEFET